MKSKIGKILMAVCSIISMSSTAFCTGENEKPKKFSSKDDYWALGNVIKKTERDQERFWEYDAVPDNGNIYFPGMSTYIIGSNSTFKPLTFDELYDEIGYERNIDRIVFKPGSFNISLFCRIADMNNIKGMVQSIEPLAPQKDYRFPMSIVKNGFKFVISNSNTGKTIEFDFLFGKTIPPQGERYTLKNAILAYNQFVDIFYASEVYNPYGIDLCKVDENDVNNDFISDIIAASGLFISKGCFKNCRFTKTLSMAEARSIGEEAFENCLNLKDVRMPKVMDIGENAFSGCKSLKTVSMPNVKIIDSRAFEGCENLESVFIPKVEYISVDAFKGCKNLKVIEIPKSTRILNYNAFTDCSADLKIIYGGTIYKNINQFIQDVEDEQ